VRAYYNPTLQVAGVLINQHEENTVSGRAWVEDLAEAATARGLRILTPSISKRVVIADAVEASRGLDEWGVVRRPPSPPSTPTTWPPSKEHAHERPTRTPPIQPHRGEPDRAAARRAGGRSGASPAPTPEPQAPAPAAPASTTVPTVDAAPAGTDKPRSKYPPKVSFYQSTEDTDRIRGAIMHTIPYEGTRTLSQFLSGAAMKEAERLEAQYNGGKPFPRVGARELPQARPMGE